MQVLINQKAYLHDEDPRWTKAEIHGDIVTLFLLFYNMFNDMRERVK